MDASPNGTDEGTFGPLAVPAPIDIHFHGAGGVTVPPSGTYEELDDVLARIVGDSLGPDAGPYRYVATLPVPQRPPAPVVEHIAAAASAIEDSVGCMGLRIEGLFLNPARAGVWPPETFAAPDVGLLDELVAAAAGHLRIIDVAPELPGAIALIERAREHGLVVAIAHTDATWDEARRAFDAGATLATHTFNAMRPIHHREPGVIAAALTDPRVTCEVIADGHHVHPGAIALMHAAAPGRVAAVSDASPFAGEPPGVYDWNGIEIHSDGAVLRDSAGHLSGAATLLPGMLGTLLAAGLSRADAAFALGVANTRVLEPEQPIAATPVGNVWILD